MSFSIIIPSKSAANLVPCIRAIREAWETARIIVVDDGIQWPRAGLNHEDAMTMGSVTHGKVGVEGNIIPGVKPFVFARNINIGIRAAGDDDVILLNDDALLKTPGGFTLLSQLVHEQDWLGMLAPACDTVGNPNQFRRHVPGTDAKTIAIRLEPRMVCFVCVYIPRSTINAVGLLDERFVDYGLDDDDYSLRVRKAGLKLGIFDGCFVDHGALKSSYRGGPQAGGDFRPNMRRFIEKWGTDNWGRGRDTSEFAHLFPKEGK